MKSMGMRRVVGCRHGRPVARRGVARHRERRGRGGGVEPCKVITDDHWPDVVQGRPAGASTRRRRPRPTCGTTATAGTSGSRTTARTCVPSAGSCRRAARSRTCRRCTSRRATSSRCRVTSTSITFLFKNYGYIDGVNFHTRCAPSISVCVPVGREDGSAEQDRHRSQRCPPADRSRSRSPGSDARRSADDDHRASYRGRERSARGLVRGPGRRTCRRCGSQVTVMRLDDPGLVAVGVGDDERDDPDEHGLGELVRRVPRRRDAAVGERPAVGEGFSPGSDTLRRERDLLAVHRRGRRERERRVSAARRCCAARTRVARLLQTSWSQ